MTLYANTFEGVVSDFETLSKIQQNDLFYGALEYIKSYEIKSEKLLGNFEFAFEVSKICATEIIASPYLSATTILYYCIPHAQISIEDIKNKFGVKPANIISGLIKIPDIKLDKLSIHSENFIELVLTITPDITTILIKLAEMLYHLRNLNTAIPEEQYSLASVISRLYAPIAHRLGLYSIKTEMEDISMKYLHSKMYKEIAQKLEETKDSRNKFIQEFIAPLNKELAKNHIKCEIKGRPKSIYSIWNKMKAQDVDFEEVYDKFAIRIIIDCGLENEKTDCWRVYSIVTDWYKPNPHRLRDWISSPKASGYESLHTTVIGPEQKWVEVQIRTNRMDEIAEKGHAAHWKYKEKKEGQGLGWVSQLREVLEKPEEFTDAKRDKNKSALYSDDIFIFTPDNDLRKLKSEHTVLDFAFSIHSGVGEKCTGAYVNDKIVPIKHVLKNGDHVKILTAKNQKPRYEWLEIVKSQKAKNKIKRSLKSINYKDSDIGKDMIKHKLNQLKIPFNDININLLTEQLAYKTSFDMYQALGDGKLEIHKIKKAFVEINKKQEEEEENKGEKYQEVVDDIPFFDTKDFLIIENNLKTIDYQMARCCNPILGDEIFGFITVSKGTKIHKKNCSNANDLIGRYPYRVIKARWNKDSETTKFIVQIRITGRDNIGVTSSITEIISKEFKLNLQALSIRPRKDDKFEGIIVCTVNDKKQLDNLIKRLQRIDDIISVSRISK